MKKESTPISTESDLEGRCRVRALEPFGLEILAGGDDALQIDGVAPELLERLVRVHALVLLRGFDQFPRERFLAYARAFPTREPLEWDFGPVMELHERPEPANYLFSSECVPFHWDGAFHRVPSHLMFSCIEAPGEGAGGETLFCSTRAVWKRADARTRRLWRGLELTFRTEKKAHYGGVVTVPLVGRHPESPEAMRAGAETAADCDIILRYAEPVETRLNPVSLEVAGLPSEVSESAFIEDMRQRIYAPETCLRHAWQRNDFLVADNHALIHGRAAFRSAEPRHLRRIQLIGREARERSLP